MNGHNERFSQHAWTRLQSRPTPGGLTTLWCLSLYSRCRHAYRVHNISAEARPPRVGDGPSLRSPAHVTFGRFLDGGAYVPEKVAALCVCFMSRIFATTYGCIITFPTRLVLFVRVQCGNHFFHYTRGLLRLTAIPKWEPCGNKCKDRFQCYFFFFLLSIFQSINATIELNILLLRRVDVRSSKSPTSKEWKN